jgi:predicted metal-dependent hydrolase
MEMKTGPIEYTLKRSARARNIRLSIYRDARVEAVLPNGLSLDKLEEFIQKKSDWILKKTAFFKKRFSECDFILPEASRRNYLAAKKESERIIRPRVNHFCSLYDVNYKKITIRNQKTSWGSCSRNGNLNFQWRIVHLPEELFDYIIVHEICHLLELNHSSKFWKLVERTIPGYKEARKKLKNVF